MSNPKKYVKSCLILTNIFLILLIVLAVFLPFMVSWYVEIRGRAQSLPATIMVTCYPCAPFLGTALIMLKRILKRIYNDNFFSVGNSNDLFKMAYCCLIISVITLIAGRFYLPFFIVAGTFLFLSLVAYSLRAVFRALSEKYGEN